MARAVGIDLGTTNSVVSVLEGGEPTIITNAEGTRTTPSVVAFAHHGEVLVGEVAKRRAVTNPHRTVRAVKREMGTDWAIDIDGKRYTPQEVAARVLMKLKREAEAYLGEQVTDVVITVPALFGDAQRTATKEAAEIAGLRAVRIIAEPAAVAMAHGLGQAPDEQTILVYDLGAGGLSVAVVEIGSGIVEVKSTSGDLRLGGDAWDERIVEHLVKSFRGRHGIDLSADRTAVQRLREAAEKAKIELSTATTASIDLPYITGGPLHLDAQLTRAEFQSMTQDLLDRTKVPFNQAIKDAGIRVEALDHVILTGGSTRMPAVADLVRQLIGREPDKSLNPDEAVAVGAALQAGVLKGEIKDLLLYSVTPCSLGIETKGGIMHRLVERNTPIPAKRSEVYSTVDDNQSSFTVTVFEGEAEMAAYNRRLCSLELTGIPPAPRGVPQIEVTFDIDANGTGRVAAKDLGTGKEASMTITGGTALPRDDIERMTRDAREHAEEDRRRREEAETRNLAEALQWQTEKFLAETDLPARDRREVTEALGGLRDALGRADAERIRAAHGLLETVVQGVGSRLYADSQRVAESILEAKVLLLGEGTVGKTSLVAALRGREFRHHDQTHGIEVHLLRVRHPDGDAELTLRLWDFGGQAVYRMVHQFFYSPRALFVLVWNARAGERMNDVRGWLYGIRSRVGPDAKVMLVATHCDEQQPELDYAVLQQQYRGMLCGLYAVDNATGTGVADLRAAIARHAVAAHHEDLSLPRSWLAARDAVLGRARDEPHIAFQEFAAVCARNGLSEADTDVLAERMHHLGQIVQHDDVVILDPEWLSKTIGKVIDDRRTREDRGVLDHARLAEIWPAEQRWLRPHLLRLMERFDLSFRLDDDRHSLVAQLVPAAPPPLPWTAAVPCPPGVRHLRREFRLAEPVPGLMAALTVRLHGSGVGLHWRNGVFLRHPNAQYDSSALLTLDDGDRLRLETRAPAPELFFHMLLGAVEAYFERRWPGLRVEQFLPCPTCDGRFPLERLRSAHGTVQCSTCFRHHAVADLLHGGASDDLARRLGDLQAGLDRLDQRLETMQTESAHALRLLLAFVTTEITDCPRLFTLTRHIPTGLAKVKVHQDHYRLTLWCEEPDHCHPWPASSVTFEQTKQWVARIARYTRPVYTLLRSTVPLAGAVAGLLIHDQQTLATANAELDMVQALLVDLPPDAQPGPPIPAGGAHLREVRDFLTQHCGPYFGGLSRAAAPTGEYLWVCPEHLTRYEPGLPLVD